uniref:Uncharacterized protein n=1 Tax=Lepeophtheirus salmonis TaxID=72036 RepID=A0A0K2TTX3_LEPSM
MNLIRTKCLRLSHSPEAFFSILELCLSQTCLIKRSCQLFWITVYSKKQHARRITCFLYSNDFKIS